MATWETAAAATEASGILNLGVGQPALSLLPTELLRRAALHALGGGPGGADANVDPRYLLQYGATEGNGPFLKALAKFLGPRCGYHVNQDNLFETNGNSHGIGLVSATLSNPGDVVLIEDPSYFLAHDIFKDNGLRMVAARQAEFRVGVATVTLDLDALEGTIQSTEPKPKLLYLVPTANNPTGSTMQDADRVRLIKMCKAHGITIISDDVYQLMTWGGRYATIPTACHPCLSCSKPYTMQNVWTRLGLI